MKRTHSSLTVSSLNSRPRHLGSFPKGSSPLPGVDELVRTQLFPLGPFECVDAVGTDVMIPAIQHYILRYPDQHKYNGLLTALKAMRSEGKLGVKSGQGFFDYRPDAPSGKNLPDPVDKRYSRNCDLTAEECV